MCNRFYSNFLQEISHVQDEVGPLLLSNSWFESVKNPLFSTLDPAGSYVTAFKQQQGSPRSHSASTSTAMMVNAPLGVGAGMSMVVAGAEGVTPPSATHGKGQRKMLQARIMQSQV